MDGQGAQPIPVNDNAEKTESAEDKGRGSNRRRHHRRGGHKGQQQQYSASPESAINIDVLREIAELIDQHGFTDFEYEREDIHIRLRKEPASTTIAAPTVTTSQPQAVAAAQTQQPVAQTSTSINVPHPGAQSEAQAAEDESLYKITSPIIGTFYRSPSPEAEPFIKIGSHVNNDTVVCIVEAMKLMNEIQAETSGEVVKIYVENGQPVEYGQPLFGIKK